MGYDAHITRAEQWSDNEGHWITESEWQDTVGRDPDLEIDQDNGPHFTIWKAHPDDTDSWLNWDNGNITTKNPDEPLLCKMVEIALRLGARVQGDDGEFYDDGSISHTVPSTIWSRLPLVSLIVSLTGVIAIAGAVALDSSVRQIHPVGTPVPALSALILAGLMCLGILIWLAGTVFAIVACLIRQPRWRLAVLALMINCSSALYLLLDE